MAICKKQDYEHQIKWFISHDRLPLTACQFLSILFTSVFKLQVLSVMYLQSRRQRSTDEGAAEVTKGGDDVAQSKNK